VDDTLNTYANQGYNLFLFMHEGMECYDEILDESFRCGNQPAFDSMVRSHIGEYVTISVMSGHNHANIYDSTDAANGMYHFSTTATINYPTEARIITIGENMINYEMSPSFSSEVDNLSLNILNGIGTYSNLSFYGSETDRTKSVSLQSFTGVIDEVAVWNRTLSATEIKDLYRLKADTYFWKVNATDSFNNNNESATWQFTIDPSASINRNIFDYINSLLSLSTLKNIIRGIIELLNLNVLADRMFILLLEILESFNINSIASYVINFIR
ncbi:unnamed protein product, partial [marine sediment metagenome]